MTIARNIITLALTTSGALGVGQTPQAQDVTDTFNILNDMIDQWNVQRTVLVIPGVLDRFPDLTSDVQSWSRDENVLIWGLSARCRPLFGMPEDPQQTRLAEQAVALLQANNMQQQPSPPIGATDQTGYGLIYLALRAAGRVTDSQGITQDSQDVSDAALLMQEMLDEWTLGRQVTVTPGTLPLVSDLTAVLALPPGYRSAIVLNLACRVREAFGADENKMLMERASRALALVQANNKHQVAPLHPGMPATAVQIVYMALRVAGRINDTQSVTDSSADVDNALSMLSMMLAQWSKERWLVFNEVDVTATSTGDLSYTIGRNGAFNLASRAERITSAFVRMPPPPRPADGDFSPQDFGPDFSGGDQTAIRALSVPANAIDYPLDVLGSREDYNLIGLKGLTSFPSAVFLDTNYPLGTVYVWPIPAAGQFEIHLTVKATLPAYVGLDDPLNLPPEYNEAMIYNLAFRLLVLTGNQPSPSLMGLARATLQTIRKANVQIPRLRMPWGLPGGRSSYGSGGGYGASALGSVVNGNAYVGGLLGLDGAQLLGADGAPLIATGG